MSVVRGRPPGLAGGIKGASRADCSSLSACPAPKSPTKARLSAVHMACLQEGLLPSMNLRHDHSASPSVSTERAFQTVSKDEQLYSEIARLDPKAAGFDPESELTYTAITRIHDKAERICSELEWLHLKDSQKYHGD